jgi:hypothetical protein
MGDRSLSFRPVDNHNTPILLGMRPERQQPTTSSQIDHFIALLVAKKDEWATTAARDRINLLDSVTAAFAPLCDSWVQLSLVAKGAEQDTYASGWEWASGPMPILRYLRALKRTMAAIERSGSPPLPSAPVTRPNGQVSVTVYPKDIYETLITPGTTIEVWMEPGLSAGDVLFAQAHPKNLSRSVGKVCLVLGAGNVSGGPFNDALCKLFVDNCVVLLKMNPVSDYLGPLIETGLNPLISRGYLQVVYGGASEGTYICSHPSIDCIHMMGSDRTYEAVTFGTGPEAQRRKTERQSICAKPISAALGNVAPAIIVPGPWREQDLKYQSQQLASNLCDSGSYSCSRTRVIVQHAGWNLRQHLLDGLLDVLSSVPARIAYYPGAVELYERFVSAHPQARSPGATEEGTLPWTVITGIDPGNPDEICFTTESFCPVIAETSLEAPSIAEFLDHAVDFVNNHLWGTLSASIIVHPQSLRDPEVSEAIERAIETLHYGVIVVNCLPGLVWGIAVPPWGSYPGNPSWDIQSGSGFVHNSYMLPHPQKIVLRGPFRTWPPPPWFPSRAHRMAAICRRVAAYEANPSISRLLGIAVYALL